MQKAVVEQKQTVGAPSENPWQAWTSYATDFAQRSVLFWDVLRERGNNYIEHKKEGTPPLLAFKWEIISDGRTFATSRQLRPDPDHPARGRENR